MPSWRGSSAALKRRNWRVKQAAAPAVQARHQPPYPRAVGRRACRAPPAGQPAPADALLLSRAHARSSILPRAGVSDPSRTRATPGRNLHFPSRRASRSHHSRGRGRDRRVPRETVYWAPDIFRLLARPLMENLPKDGKMIVTDVTGSFFVPMKVTMLVALVIALPIVLYQIWAFVAPGLYQHEEARRAARRQQLPAVPVRDGVRVLPRVSDDLPRDGALQRAARRGNDHRHRQLPELRARDVHRVRGHVRVPIVVVLRLGWACCR